jgi:hypothetical protein
MAKIYSNNKQFNGISASVNFVDGVGESNIPHLLSWFIECGYTVIEEKKEPSVYDAMAYKELTELAKEHGFNGIGLKKEQLIIALVKSDKENKRQIDEIETTTNENDIEMEE